MSRAVFESVPVTPEIELRLRRVEERLARIETPHDGAAHADVDRARTSRWVELEARLDALALKLKLHYEQAGGDGVPRALSDLPNSVREAFAAAGNAASDDAVRADVREVGVMMAEAVAAGLSTVGSDLRDAVHHQDVKKSPTV